VSQALARGDQVTVFVRHPERLTERSERLRVVTGSVPEDAAALGSAMAGQDAVISALGVGNSFRSGGLISRSVPAIVQAMRQQGVRRLVFTSAYGVGETFRDVPIVPRIFIRLLLRDIYADKQAGEQALRRSELDWTIVHPTTLADGPRTGRYRVGERLALRGFPRISRADVADFLLAQTDDRTFLRKGVLISS
jgi:putative NADH-flavin reductase